MSHASISRPIVGLALGAVAAIVNVMTLWLGRRQSTMNVVATVITVAAALFIVGFVIGEGLGSA